jgi:arabinofuranosyltransferase
LTALAFLASVAVFIKNAWVSEDAYIIFRSLEQLFTGHGPVWNPHERVQVFTSPLWFWLLAAIRLFSVNVFLNAISLGLVLWLTTLVVLRRVVRTPGVFLLVVMALLASNGLSDFTSSGLENSLLYLLLVLFVLFFAQTTRPDTDPDHKALTGLWIVAGLILLTRLDQLFLVAPAVVATMWQRRNVLSRGTAIRLLVFGLGPILLWTVFSLVYYGFPLPNTAYAKLNTGIDSIALLRQGIKYFLTSLGFDTITLMVVGAFVWWGRRLQGVRLLAAGVVLQLGYVACAGGDFMQGRFLAGSYLVAVTAAASLTTWRLAERRAVWVGLVLYTAFYPHTPVNIPARYPVPEITMGVADERGIYNDVLSLWQYLSCRRDGRSFPDMVWRREAEEFRVGDLPAVVVGNIGVFGYVTGTEKIIIDGMALSDPLLARIPVTDNWLVGHYPRPIPAGYVASLTGNKTGELEDARLQELYEDLILITRSEELFGGARWRAILRRNF